MVPLQGIQHGAEAGKGLHGVVIDRGEDLFRGLGKGDKIDPPGRQRFVIVAVEKGELILPAFFERHPDALQTPRHGIGVEVQRIGQDSVKIEKKKGTHRRNAYHAFFKIARKSS